MQVTAQDTLTMSINRNVGMALGNLIQGSFTLQGSGPDTIQNLTVFFNGEQVHFVVGDSITWQFDTGNYDSGSVNITLYGIDNVGAVHSTSIQVVFIGGIVSTILTFGIIALVTILLIAKYGSSLRRKK